MKVYLVWRGAYEEDRDVVAVRLDKKRANILAKYYKGYVEEMDTEDGAYLEDRKLLWRVDFCGIKPQKVKQEDPYMYSEDDSFEGTIFVRTRTEEEAIKIASERQKELLKQFGEYYDG